MIKVKLLDGREIFLNADLIEYVEAIPETLIVLVNGKKFLVKDKVEDVVRKIIKYHRMTRILEEPLEVG